MNHNDSLLSVEINAVLADGTTALNKVDYDLILHTPEYDLYQKEVMSVEILSDYNGNVTDYIIVDFIMPMGDYVKTVLPNKEYCEITLLKKIGDYTNEKRYRAVFMNSDKSIENSDEDRKDLDKLNTESYAKVKMQCISSVAEALLNKTTSGIYQNTTVTKTLFASYTKALKDMTVNNQPIDLKFNITNADNNRLYNHINIPTGTKVLDLASYMHGTEFGVYNGYIGTFLTHQRKAKVEYINDEEFEEVLYTYPLYRNTGYDAAKRKLNIYVLPGRMASMYDITYSDNDTTIEILASDLADMFDGSVNELANKGSGYNALETDSVMKRSMDNDESKLSTGKDKYMVDDSLDTQGSGVKATNNAGMTNNHYLERSKLLKSRGRVLTTQWNFSRPELLIPGMAVRFSYENNDEVKEVFGTLQGVFTKVDANKKMSSSVLNIFLEN